jgi:hypothetical protein
VSKQRDREDEGAYRLSKAKGFNLLGFGAIIYVLIQPHGPDYVVPYIERNSLIVETVVIDFPLRSANRFPTEVWVAEHL